ncbi:ankyrin repeat-containing domain protein [Nemania abortiva]|nr:ankyrin repeat-containing domain protein [Nemania abortiva]
MGNLGIIEPLINHAQNKDEYVTTKDHLDCTALHCAAETKNANVMELLISHAKNKDEYIAAGNSSQKTALHCAAQLGRLETVKILFTLSEIASSECINRQCSDGRTPLHYAALAPKNGEVIFFLLQQRADPQLQDKDGNAAWDITLRPRKARSKSSSKKKTLDKGIPDKEIPRDEMDWGNIAAFVLYASDPERSPEEIAEEINEESFEDSSEDNSKQNSEQRRAVDTLDSNVSILI